MRLFARHLIENISVLHNNLSSFSYNHASYERFNISDPKQRIIHKASVQDRLLHHAVYRILYPIFDKSFIFDSYSCRLDKGTHKAVERLEYFTRKVSKNYTGRCYALKCDVKKFFDSVDHQILFNLIKQKIGDKDILSLIWNIISSFSSETERERERESKKISAAKGLPIGNLTSQLFANIYLNELDQFLKHQLKIKYYLRYCDDFVILDKDLEVFRTLIRQINNFLNEELKLGLHPNKVIIRKLKQGIDFLGYVILPHYRTLRTKTKKRMYKRINSQNLSSYLGLLKHCNSFKLRENLLKSKR